MTYALPLAGLALAHLLAAMSPGPSFLLVSRLAIARSRRHALAAALAMGIGATAWAAAALLGLAVVLARNPELYAALRIAGGLYLAFLAVRLWRGAGRGAPAEEPGVEASSVAAAFRTALLVQLTNPKVAVFFGSIFVGLLPPGWPGWVTAAVLALVLVDETLWYAAVATAFSTEGPRLVYQRVRTTLDRALAGVLGLLAVKLVLDRT